MRKNLAVRGVLGDAEVRVQRAADMSEFCAISDGVGEAAHVVVGWLDCRDKADGPFVRLHDELDAALVGLALAQLTQ